MLLALSLLKDFAGLAGSILIALPFFSQEGAKRLARRLAAVQSDDPAITELYRSAASRQRDLMQTPSDRDLRNTRTGLALIILSFALSIAVTLAPCGK